MNADVVVHGDMLDDRKPESRAVDHFGMAFVHAEEAFENAFTQIVRNADARVGNAYLAARVNRNIHPAAILVILDSVVADAEKALCALDGAPYVTFVASLFASCGELKNPVVYLQENRVSQKAALQTRLGTDRLEFVPYVDGGVLIREDDIDYDCRVSTVLNRFRNEHEPELQEILFGDNR